MTALLQVERLNKLIFGLRALAKRTTLLLRATSSPSHTIQVIRSLRR